MDPLHELFERLHGSHDQPVFGKPRSDERDLSDSAVTKLHADRRNSVVDLHLTDDDAQFIIDEHYQLETCIAERAADQRAERSLGCDTERTPGSGHTESCLRDRSFTLGTATFAFSREGSQLIRVDINPDNVETNRQPKRWRHQREFVVTCGERRSTPVVGVRHRGVTDPGPW